MYSKEKLIEAIRDEFCTKSTLNQQLTHFNNVFSTALNIKVIKLNTEDLSIYRSAFSDDFSISCINVDSESDTVCGLIDSEYCRVTFYNSYDIMFVIMLMIEDSIMHNTMNEEEEAYLADRYDLITWDDEE